MSQNAHNMHKTNSNMKPKYNPNTQILNPIRLTKDKGEYRTIVFVCESPESPITDDHYFVGIPKTYICVDCIQSRFWPAWF